MVKCHVVAEYPSPPPKKKKQEREPVVASVVIELFLGPSSSALFLPLWVNFQHETLPLVSGLTQGRPCLHLFTTRSLYRPVHTCSSGSLHHFQLVKLLLRSSPLQENMIIDLRPLHTSTVEHVLTSGSDIFWS